VTPNTSGAAQLPRARDGCRSRVRICVNSQSPSPIVNTRPPRQAFQSRKIQRNADRPTPEQCAPIRAALIGSHRCEAEGISVCAAGPVLALCRNLVSAGHDPRPLHAYRGNVLTLRVRSIGEGMQLAIAGDGVGFRRRKGVAAASRSDFAKPEVAK
jgi:hypothetical protein